MTTAMDLSGVKSPCTFFSNRALHSHTVSLDHSASVASFPRFFSALDGRCRRRVVRVSCDGTKGDDSVLVRCATEGGGGRKLTHLMKFDRFSMASAWKMREVADHILSFPLERPVILISCMGEAIFDLLMAGSKAANLGDISSIKELSLVKEFHHRVLDNLYLERSIVSGLFIELEELLMEIAKEKQLADCRRDQLVSLGECLSAKVFASYLNKNGVKARIYDAFDIGYTISFTKTSDYPISFAETSDYPISFAETSDYPIRFAETSDFTGTDFPEEVYLSIADRLYKDSINDDAIPVVTGSMRLRNESGEVTPIVDETVSDLTSISIGKLLGFREIQVWKDKDRVVTCDHHLSKSAKPVSFLTFDEAAELACFGVKVLHPQSLRLARDGDISVRVKNSNDRTSPGTLITRTRDMNEAVLNSIVVRQNVTMLDIVNTRMPGQCDFFHKVYSKLKEFRVPATVLASSDVSISLRLEPWADCGELFRLDIKRLVQELEKIAVVNLLKHRSIISLVGNAQRSPLVLEKALEVLRNNKINVEMISYGASKVDISLIVIDGEAEKSVRALHWFFFERDPLN